MAKKKEKPVSTNTLARMVGRGFEAVDKRFKETHEEIGGLRKEMNDRFDRVENILLRSHDNRLEKLEDFMLQTKTLLKIK